MSAHRVANLSGRWLIYAAGTWLLMLLAAVIWWPSVYVTQPLFIPFSAYTWSGEYWTVFSDERLGWPVNIAYSAVLPFIAVWLSRNLTLAKSAAVFLSLVLLISVAVHGLMHLLGFHYWYDGP
jgi:hypothetical protein